MIGCNSTLNADTTDQIANLQVLAQEWERLLFSTGGALNLSKCFWFILSWRWNHHHAVCDTSETLPGALYMTSGKDTSSYTEIKRVELHESYRTLGVHISPNGSSAGALTVLTDITIGYNAHITASTINRAEAFASFAQHLLPKLRFQMPVLSLTQTQWNKLSTIALAAFLPKIHINRNTTRSIVFGPYALGGLAIPNLYTVQGIDKLHLFLGHIRLQDDTGGLIQIDLSYIQLLTGLSTFFLNANPAQYRWLESGWLTSLWEFINKADIQIHYPGQWLPTKPRRNNIFLMEYFLTLRLKPNELKSLNTCRLYLQVITLTDITSADGTYRLREAKLGM
jgi:hypothetical protein